MVDFISVYLARKITGSRRMARPLKSLPQAAIHIDLDGASAIFAIHGWSFPHERDPLFESGLLNALEFLDSMDLKATMVSP